MSARRSFEYEVAILLILLVLFAGLAFLVSHAGTDDNDHALRVGVSTVGIVLGPFVGALNRGGMSSCVEFGFELLPWALVPLVSGVAAALCQWPRSHGVRLTLWTIGWVAWFASGIVSFGYALG